MFKENFLVLFFYFDNKEGIFSSFFWLKITFFILYGFIFIIFYVFVNWLEAFYYFRHEVISCFFRFCFKFLQNRVDIILSLNFYFFKADHFFIVFFFWKKKQFNFFFFFLYKKKEAKFKFICNKYNIYFHLTQST